MPKHTIALQAAQPAMYYLEKQYPNTTINHLCLVVEIMGDFDPILFKNALFQLQNRHEVLRATLQEQNENVYFELSASPELPLQQFDGSHLKTTPTVNQFQDTLKQLHAASWFASFSLAQSPLWRCALLKLDKKHFQLGFLFNSIIVDRAAANVLLRDLSHFYQAQVKHTAPTLPPLATQCDETPKLTAAALQQRLQFWKTNLADMNVLSLPADLMSNEAFDFRGQRAPFHLSADIINRWREHPAIKANHISMRVLFLAALYTVLSRYTEKQDICIGITNRPTHELRVNSFFNSIPLRLLYDKSFSFIDLCLTISAQERHVLDNEIPLDILMQAALSRTTLASLTIASPFTTLLICNDEETTFDIPGTYVSKPADLALDHCKLPDYALNLFKTGDSYQGYIEFNTKRYHQSTITRLINHFSAVMHFASLQVEADYATIPILHASELKAISVFNNTEKPPFFRGKIHDYLHQYAQNNPTQNALFFHDDQHQVSRLTYGEWDTQSTQLAHYLIEQGVKPGTRVGMSLARSFNLYIALFAILKAGGVFVPLETTSSEILPLKISEANLALVIADLHTCHLFSDQMVPLIKLHDFTTLRAISAKNRNYTFPALEENQLAYIMYTSGTTGDKPVPKGVMISHRGIGNLFNSLLLNRPNTPCNILSTANVTFDAHLYDILVALSCGQGTLHFADKGQFSPEFIGRMIKQEKINYAVLLPDLLTKLDPRLPLKHIITMGAAPNEENLLKWRANHPDLIIESGYGLTETSIKLSSQFFSPGKQLNLIGKPIANMQAHIVAPNSLTLCPIGIPGELCVSGAGLAVGYLNHPALTATRFFYARFDQTMQRFMRCTAETPEAIRLYPTGDYANYYLLPNYSLTIQYIGRTDRQIKLNGVRLDLNYIEALLRAHPQVKEATVLVNAAKTALKAFVVPQDEKNAQDIIPLLRQHLAKYPLPAVATPQQFKFLAMLPTTPNGKVDNRALAAIPEIMVTQAPTSNSPLKQVLIEIWAQVLSCNVNQIDVKSTFKELGGHSLLLKELESLINKRFGKSHNVPSSGNKMPGVILKKRISLTARPQELTIDGFANFLKPFLVSTTPSIGLPANVSLSRNRITIHKLPPTSTPAATDKDSKSYKH